MSLRHPEGFLLLTVCCCASLRCVALLQVLKGHTITGGLGVLHCVFHPTQPWVFTAGADGRIHLYTNVHR